MQIVETEIARANSPYFGEVVCLADESGNPCFWAIKKKMDELFVKEFNEEKIDWEIGEDIESIDDVKRSIKVVRVEIIRHYYHVVFFVK